MDDNLIINSHLLPLSIDDDKVDQNSDSGSAAADSDIEVNGTDYINDDLIRFKPEHDGQPW